MNALFEELDYSITPLGPLSLRRRYELALHMDIYEVILGDHHLMSSLFTASEIALGKLGIAQLDRDDLDVVIGGLGLGYTAQAVLASDRVKSLAVVELMRPVIEWHENGILPLATALIDDPRCQIIEGDFFAMAASRSGFIAANPAKKVHAILVDIDHTPDFYLNAESGNFYEVAGLMKLREHLHPGGVFGLWSDAAADPAFVERLQLVFEAVRTEPVTFRNPLQNREFTQTVYLASKAK